jgi:hypothetical protein
LPLPGDIKSDLKERRSHKKLTIRRSMLPSLTTLPKDVTLKMIENPLLDSLLILNLQKRIPMVKKRPLELKGII